jgi:hypothetical protein
MGPRRHIVYLLAAVPPSEASSQPKTRIISGRRSAEDEEDELQLLIFSRILLHQQKGKEAAITRKGSTQNDSNRYRHDFR